MISPSKSPRAEDVLSFHVIHIVVHVTIHTHIVVVEPHGGTDP